MLGYSIQPRVIKNNSRASVMDEIEYPQSIYAEALISIVTVFGHRAFKEVFT